MRRIFGLGVAAIAATAFFCGNAAAQPLPNSVDPYELAPQNVHLYPVTLDARQEDYYYLPPIFAPAPMWRGALDADVVRSFAPFNYVAYEIPDSTALVAWGRVKGDKRMTMEAANQQEFMILPPENLDHGQSFYNFRTTMRYVDTSESGELDELLDRELLLPPSRVSSIADRLPVETLLWEYDRVSDIANIQVNLNDVLLGGAANADGLGVQAWPLDRIYISYSGWRRNPNVIRTGGQATPEWLTIEGKLVALKEHGGHNYMITVYFEGYNPWHPIETSKNVLRKLVALSFNEFIETTSYIDFEKPVNGKEWHRQGSGKMKPFDTRRITGMGEYTWGNY